MKSNEPTSSAPEPRPERVPGAKSATGAPTPSNPAPADALTLKTPSGRRWPSLRWVLLALMAIAFGAAGLTHWLGRLSLNRYRAALAAAGEPLTIAQLGTAAPPEAYAKGAALSVAMPQLRAPANSLNSFAMGFVAPGQARRASTGPSLTVPGQVTNSWEQIDELLRSRAGALDQLRSLLAEPPLPANALDYSQGFSLPLPHLAQSKSAATFVSLSVLHQLHLKDLAAAHREHLALIYLPQVMKQDHLLISELVAAALQVIALQITWECLLTPGWTDPQLAAWQRAWDQRVSIQDFTRAVRVERALAIEFVEKARRSTAARQELLVNLGAGASQPSPTPSFPSRLDDAPDFVSKWINAAMSRTALVLRGQLWRWFHSYPDEERYLRLTQELVDALKAIPNPGQPAAAGSPRRWTRPKEDRPSSKYLISQTLTESYERFLERALRAEATRRLIVVTIALERYRLRQGEPAPALQALVPEFLDAIPLDPMDGKPFRYRPSNKPIPEVYSVGTDATDDGGNPASVNPRTKHFVEGRDLLLPQPKPATAH